MPNQMVVPPRRHNSQPNNKLDQTLGSKFIDVDEFLSSNVARHSQGFHQITKLNLMSLDQVITSITNEANQAGAIAQAYEEAEEKWTEERGQNPFALDEYVIGSLCAKLNVAFEQTIILSILKEFIWTYIECLKEWVIDKNNVVTLALESESFLSLQKKWYQQFEELEHKKLLINTPHIINNIYQDFKKYYPLIEDKYDDYVIKLVQTFYLCSLAIYQKPCGVIQLPLNIMSNNSTKDYLFLLLARLSRRLYQIKGIDTYKQNDESIDHLAAALKYVNKQHVALLATVSVQVPVDNYFSMINRLVRRCIRRNKGRKEISMPMTTELRLVGGSGHRGSIFRKPIQPQGSQNGGSKMGAANKGLTL